MKNLLILALVAAVAGAGIWWVVSKDATSYEKESTTVKHEMMSDDKMEEVADVMEKEVAEGTGEVNQELGENGDVVLEADPSDLRLDENGIEIAP